MSDHEHAWRTFHDPKTGEAYEACVICTTRREVAEQPLLRLFAMRRWSRTGGVAFTVGPTHVRVRHTDQAWCGAGLYLQGRSANPQTREWILAPEQKSLICAKCRSALRNGEPR